MTRLFLITLTLSACARAQRSYVPPPSADKQPPLPQWELDVRAAARAAILKRYHHDEQTSSSSHPSQSDQ